MYYYQQDAWSAYRLVLFFTHRPIFGFFCPAGARRCTDPWSVQVYGFTAPKFKKNWNFTNIIAPKGRFPCTILTKFTGFMHVLCLHNSYKFGCFSLINDKIMHNFPRWGHFQPNFRWLLAAKLLIVPKIVWGWNDGTDHLCHLGGNRTKHVSVRGWSVIFSLFSVCSYIMLGRIMVTSDAVALFKRR